MDVRLENEYRNYTDKYNLKETLKWKSGYRIYLPSILVNCFLRLKQLEKKVSFIKAIILNSCLCL